MKIGKLNGTAETTADDDGADKDEVKVQIVPESNKAMYKKWVKSRYPAFIVTQSPSYCNPKLYSLPRAVYIQLQYLYKKKYCGTACKLYSTSPVSMS